jgi:hypothetical protein
MIVAGGKIHGAKWGTPFFPHFYLPIFPHFMNLIKIEENQRKRKESRYN